MSMMLFEILIFCFDFVYPLTELVGAECLPLSPLITEDFPTFGLPIIDIFISRANGLF